MFVGIDVSKDRLDVRLRPSGEAFAVAHDGRGLETLVSRLVAHAPVLVVLEATGGFGQLVAAALAAASLPLAVVNPAQIRAFARATGRLAKTDRLDAEAIAWFAEAVRPEPRPVASAQADALAELVAWPRQVVEMIGMEQNRRCQARNPKMLRGIERTLAARQAALAALVGVAPINRDSGAFRGHRAIAGGRAGVLGALYMAALTGVRWNPALRVAYERLRARGTPPKAALVAPMCKLPPSSTPCFGAKPRGKPLDPKDSHSRGFSRPDRVPTLRARSCRRARAPPGARSPVPPAHGAPRGAPASGNRQRPAARPSRGHGGL